LTQTFFIRQLFPCSRAADHTLTKFEFPAHAFGVDKIFDTLALRSIQWRHIVVLDGGIDCIQHQQWIDDTSRLFGSDLASTSDSAILRKSRLHSGHNGVLGMNTPAQSSCFVASVLGAVRFLWRPFLYG
jgi:hypothetical protein